MKVDTLYKLLIFLLPIIISFYVNILKNYKRKWLFYDFLKTLNVFEYYQNGRFSFNIYVIALLTQMDRSTIALIRYPMYT
mgnify:FL=1